MVVVKKVSEGQRQAGVLGERCRPRHKAGSAVVGGADVVQHIFRRDLFQLDIAALGRRDKALFDLPADAVGGVGEQRGKFLLEIILLVRLSDEVQYGQAFLVFGQTQAAAQLLQEHSQRLGRAQEQHGVDFRDVHALVIDVHYEDKANFPGNKPLFGGVAFLIRRIPGQRHGRDAVGVEIICHEPGVLDGGAEPKTLHFIDIGDVFQDGVHHKVGTALCHHAAEGVQVGQFGLVITAGAPFQAA